MMNFSELMKIKGHWDTFSQTHPQFVKFLNYMAKEKIEEGTVISISVKKKDSEKEIKTNLSITESDIAFIESIKNSVVKK